MSACDDSVYQDWVGRELVARRFAADPVNVPMIRHWLEAMGDTRPLGEDLPAPASMMQAWTMRGYGASVAPGGFEELVALLDADGYASVVATDSDFEFVREVLPGDHLGVEEVVESISPEKVTGLGAGRFVTTCKTYRDATGEVVATQRWRTLRFKPEPSAREVRPRPAVNLDNEFWFEAAREHRLVVQRCLDCKMLRHPPGPCCPECQSFAWDTVEASGHGSLYSYVVAHHPRHPAFDYPLLIAVVELAEGTRLITNLSGVTPDDVTIGMPLELEWLDADAELTLPVFRPVTSPVKEN